MTGAAGTILVVDDEQGVLNAMTRLFHREGMPVQVADSGEKAIEILQQEDVAVIICDHQMPGMHGDRILSEANRLRPDAFRIMLTGQNDISVVQAAINEGNVNYLIFKPWDDEALIRVVRQGAATSQLVAENYRLQELIRKQKQTLLTQNQQLEAEVSRRTEQLLAQNEHLRSLRQRADQSLRDVVGVMAGMLEHSNPRIGIHSRRISEIAVKIGGLMQVDENALRDIEFAAHLHDIGKISRLHANIAARAHEGHSVEQVDPARDYPELGYLILNKVAGFRDIALGVRHQKERFDGTGKPHGLKGKDIPLAARIIAAADAFDVLTGGSSLAHAIKKGCLALMEGGGKQFDPDIVALLINYCRSKDAVSGRDAEIELSSAEIREGMVLSRPLYNGEGVMLLQAGTRLTAEHIADIQEFTALNPIQDSVFIQTGGEETLRTEPVSAVAMDNDDVVADSLRPLASIAAEHLTTTASRPNQSLTVLVVDDQVSICNALRRELHRAGFGAVTTSSGAAALSVVQSERIGAVITDLTMPTMTGEELVDRLAVVAPNIPCIIITGNATQGRVRALLKRPNVKNILVKPWDHARLIATIVAAMDTAAVV